MLSLKDISVSYGKYNVINKVAVEMAPQQIVTILGPNGSGKTTLLLTISGLIQPVEGKILFNQKEIQGLSPDKILRLGIAQCPEGRKLFPKLSVLDNLKMGAFSRNNKEGIKTTLEEVYSLFPILRERKSQLAGTMSGGEQQILAIGRALMSAPQLLLFDEPSLGLAPLIVQKLYEKIVEINKNGIGVLLVEQNAVLALRTAQKGYLLENGRIIYSGLTVDLLKEKKVKDSYLGV
jgi:branched-chain amino acid transport system ATP-binding protein